tara:strand:+ start:67 stop:1338 length:1272 start_codon:yes stop_codon:yes gene_type:complete
MGVYHYISIKASFLREQVLVEIPYEKRVCDICGDGNSQVNYGIENSKRGNKLGVCEKCGSINLFPKENYIPENDPHSLRFSGSRHISPTEGSNWGNIRHGKGLRLSHSKDFISEAFNRTNELKTVFDDGSNRGAFMDWIKTSFPELIVKGCEPDEMIFNQCSEFVKANSQNAYLEDIVDSLSEFDFVYSAHTIEHVDSVPEHIKSIKKISKIGGTVFFDLPNTDQIGIDNISLEEYFVEKEKNNFFSSQFKRLLSIWGFEVINNWNDPYNTMYICINRDKEINFEKLDYENFNNFVNFSKSCLNHYLNVQSRSSEKLTSLTTIINKEFKDKKGIVWGGGRLLGTLLDFGLDIGNFEHVIDDHLYNKIGTFREIKLSSSEILKSIKKDTKFLINARSSTQQIQDRLTQSGFSQYFKISDYNLGI